jgi:hypothetical protein
MDNRAVEVGYMFFESKFKFQDFVLGAYLLSTASREGVILIILALAASVSACSFPIMSLTMSCSGNDIQASSI